MPLSNFRNDNGNINPAAMVQAAGLVSAIYWNDQVRAQQIIDLHGSGTIIAWQFDQDSWPPSWMAVQQGTRITICIAGTVNASQVLLHLSGAIAKPYGTSGDYVHSLWDKIASEMLPDINSIMPADLSGYTIAITGHSYGASIAHLLANYFSTQVGNNNVEVLTFAEPRAISDGYSGPQPSTHFRVVASGDIVPSLPPVSTQLMLSGISGTTLTSPVFLWSHYGDVKRFTSSGQLLTGPQSESEAWLTPNNVINTLQNTHYMSNYANIVAQYYQDNIGTAPDDQAAAITQAIINQPEVQTQNVNILRTDYINLNTASTVYFAPQSPVLSPTDLDELQSLSITSQGAKSGLNTNSGLLQGFNSTMANFYKLTLFVNNGLYGRSASFTLGGGVTWAGAENASKTLIDKYTDMLGNNQAAAPFAKSEACPMVEFYRISDAENPGVSQIYKTDAAIAFGNHNGVNTAADFFSTSVSTRLVGQNAGNPAVFRYSNWLYTGQPDGIFTSGAYNGPAINVATGVSWEKAYKDFIKYITVGTDQWGFMGTSLASTKKVLTSATVSVNDRWKVTSTAHGWAEGDVIRISAANAKGFNGTQRIINVTANDFELAKGPATSLPGFTLAKGQKIQSASGARQLDFYRFYGSLAPRMSKKNPSSQYLGVSFR